MPILCELLGAVIVTKYKNKYPSIILYMHQLFNNLVARWTLMWILRESRVRVD